MTQTEALNRALDIALEKEYELRKTGQSHMIEPVISAIKEALAQPKRDLKPRCFADFQLNHEHDRKCQWCAVETECKTGIAQPEQDWIERERAVGYQEGHQNARKQMAQPEQEPVAYCDIHHLPEPCVQCAKEHEGYNIPPQPKETEQEPVAWDGDCVLGHCGSPAGCEASNCCRADSTTPPQRKPWVSLSEEDREQHRDSWRSNIHDQEIKAIEAKLRELNEQPRQWVGLTDEDFKNCTYGGATDARRWEAVLKEKNT